MAAVWGRWRGHGRDRARRPPRSSRWGTASSPARAGAGWATGPIRSGRARAPIAPPSTAGVGRLRVRPEPRLRRLRGQRLPPLRRAPIRQRADRRRGGRSTSPARARRRRTSGGSRRREVAPRRVAAGRPAGGGRPPLRRETGRPDGRRQRPRLRRHRRRLRPRLGPQLPRRSALLPPRRPKEDRGGPAGRDARPAQVDPRGPRRDGRPPATRALATGCSSWGTRRRSRRDRQSATRRRLEPAHRGRLPALERRRRLGRAAGDAGDRRDDEGGRRSRGRRVPRPPARPRRPPALRPPGQSDRPGRPLPAHCGVVPPPRLQPGIAPRVPPPQRLRPARDRRLHSPRLRRPTRRPRLPRHPRPQLHRRHAPRALG